MKIMICKKWLTLLSPLVLFFFVPSFSCGQVPQGVNYQAVARDGQGNPIAGATINVKLSILSDSTGFYPSGGGVYVYEEQHTGVKTNAFGLFTVVLGGGAWIQGPATTFAAIDWSAMPLYMGSKIYYQNSWKTMGSARLWAVPYAMLSSEAAGIAEGSKLAVQGVNDTDTNALFIVRRKDGQVVFAVYNEGVRAYVDKGAKGSRGGFAVGGFGTGKAPSQNLMMISPDSARIYVDGTATKGYRGGFAVGGFNTNKGTIKEFMFMTPENYFVGHSSGQSVTTGKYNSTLGYQSGSNLATGSNNIFIGYQSGFTTDTGSSNVFVGNRAGYSNTKGFDNIAIGNKAGRNNVDGTYNVMIGSDAGNMNISGNYNTLMGYKSGENTTADYGTMLGYLAGNSNTSGAGQTMVGYMAGSKNTGSFNTFVGTQAGGNGTTGSFNTYIGLAAGNNASGDNNIFIGKWAGREETGSNKLVIENNYSSSDNLNNALVYGDFTTKYFKVNGEVLSSTVKSGGYAADFRNNGGLSNYYGIKITAGSIDGSGSNYMIDFNSSAGVWKGSIIMTNSAISVFNVSDARQKENISKSGMNALKILGGLQVVDYNFIKSPGIKQTGYIAQDAQKVLPEMVIYNEKADAYAISTSSLIPVLHKAIMEQQEMIDAQAKRIQTLETLVQQLINK